MLAVPQVTQLAELVSELFVPPSSQASFLPHAAAFPARTVPSILCK